ncbi:hypothetical protein B0H14DRAFT_3713790 [Mycena olivaceomarginata]|nr:hypothetical protein B0H14DRAFT_3713790 [Mycena olivaceomarginata]
MSATNTVVQRTLFGRIADEEQGFPDTRSNTRTSEPQPKMEPDSEAGGTVYKMAAGFMRKGKRKIGVVESLKAIALSSWLNLLLLFILIAWVAHFGNEHDAKEGDPQKTWKFQGTFVLCFLAIIPLEKLFDYGGEQMAFYLGEDLGDLLVVTLNNSVKLVMMLLLPNTFFAALNHGSSAAPEAESFTNDTNRHVFLQMSRGLAVILPTVLVAYICSRIFLHNPPGEKFELSQHKLAPEALKERAIEIQNAEPRAEVNQWVCIGMRTVMIGIMAATAEWVIDSVEFVRESGGMKPE